MDATAGVTGDRIAVSRIFDALQKAAADRTASAEARPETDARGAGERPAASAEAAAWWKGLIAGGVVGFMAAAVIVPYGLERQRRSASFTPVTEPPQALPVEESPPASVAEALGRPPDQPAKETDAGLESGTATVSAHTGESPDDVPGTAPREPASPDSLVRSLDRVVPASSRRTFWIQVGAFKNRDNAVQLLARLKSKHRPATIDAGRSTAAPWVLKVGRYSDQHAAEAARAVLAREGFPGFVVGGES